MSPEQFAKQELERSLKEVRKWELIIHHMELVDSPSASKSTAATKPPAEKKFLADKMTSAVSLKGAFMTGREVYVAIGSKNEYSTFSAQLGARVKKKGSLLKRYEVETKDNSLKFWYGLKKWFDGNQPKPHYKERIMERVKGSTVRKEQPENEMNHVG